MSYKSFLPRFGGSGKEESANVTQTKRKQVMWVVGLLMLAMVALYGTYSSFPSILTDESSSRASTILATEDEHPKHIVMIVADDMGFRQKKTLFFMTLIIFMFLGCLVVVGMWI